MKLNGYSAGVVLFCLAACDNTPNKALEQQLKDRDAAQADDRYSALENSMPLQRRYKQRQNELQAEFAKGAAGSFRANYDSMLTLLDGDSEIDQGSALFKTCRAAFSKASA